MFILKYYSSILHSYKYDLFQKLILTFYQRILYLFLNRQIKGFDLIKVIDYNINSLEESMKQVRQMPDLIASIVKGAKQEDHVQSLTKHHFNKALEFYKQFQESFLKTIDTDLREIQNALNVQLGRTIRKLENKLRGPYAKQLGDSLINFYLQSFISKQVQQVYKSVGKLKSKIFEYINDYCNNLLSRNIEKHHQLSLYHFSNEIKSLDKNWNSVSSRSPVNKAEISVKGFYRPQTTWLALGVTKKMKQFGPIKGAFNKQDFMGNVYLNGTDEITGDFRLKRDLNNFDVFVIQCENRMVWVYRKNQGKNKKQIFIMDDNVDYFIYIGIKGPIELKFEAE